MKLFLRRFLPMGPRRGLHRLGWAAVLGCGLVQAQSLAPLRLSAIPMSGAEVTVRQFEPLAESLSRLAGRPVTFVYLDRHEKVLDGLREGQIELAVLGPLPYAALLGNGPGQLPNSTLRVLARFKESDGQGSYRCVLVAFPDDMAGLAQTRRLTLAIANPLSTCGPLSAHTLLASVGIPWGRVTPLDLGNQAAAALAVVAGRTRLASMKESVARQHASLGLQVLAATGPLPGFVLVAHAQRIDADTLNKLARLPDMPPHEYRHWGADIRHGLLPASASDSDYAAVRALLGGPLP